MANNFINDRQNPCLSCRFREENTRLLFAEDMVRYSMRINGVSVRLIFTMRYRNLVYNAFTRNVMTSVTYLQNILFPEVSNNFANLRLGGMVTSGSFKSYCRSLVANFVSQESNSESILKTCVQIALTAVFYYLEGIPATAHIAVAVIADAINYDLSRGGWKTLQDAAESFESMYYAIENMPTPSPDSD